MTVDPRFLAAWLPAFAIEQCRQAHSPGGMGLRVEPLPGPLALIERARGRIVLTAVDRAAAAAGILPGLPLAEARAILPELRTRPARPDRDAARLDALAAWCERYSPLVTATGNPSVGEGGVLIDLTGCAHLFGGEGPLLDGVIACLHRFGHTARAAIAGTPSAAWAIARTGPARATPDRPHHPDTAIVPPGGEAAALAPLPVAGLRLDAATLAALNRVGIDRIGDLARLPRAAVARRYGAGVLDRLDQALGRRAEPISPRRPPPRFAARLVFAEPIGRTEDVALALDRLLDRVCRDLAEAGRGARRLDLAFFRVDGAVQRRQVGTVRATDRPDHLRRLFEEHLDGLDAGFGIETMTLGILAEEPVAAAQPDLIDPAADGAGQVLADLIDRLSNRLGAGGVHASAPFASHLPERAVVRRPPLARPDRAALADWPADLPPRPVRLLGRPQPVDVVAPVPDDPPVLFRWAGRTHRVVRADGPERLTPDWWLTPQRRDLAVRTRDYYRVEDEDGRRFWLFRLGPYRPERPARWYLHGSFA